ncbi:cation-transporting atpase 4 [Diplodia corticola]|uniref:Cation-transporting atpase 4 n=1 Tax=Diplodia corticola TaxID=236234 RepID=A0A1J9RPZ8_9PEZI|nr:cation-transporting atpase 4 [Diplodia corticola]OJD29988.1 cation-transporting atpase 4 [Diplodia corticola]
MLYDNSRLLALCVIVLLTSGYVSLVLRIYVRLTKSPWGWDDTCACLGAIPFAWLCAETLIAANNGLGAHEWHITPTMQKEAFKAFVFFEVAYCTSIILIKLSIALTLTRIVTDQTVILWILRTTIVVFSSVTLSVAIYCLCQCQPIAKIWDPTIEGHCHPSNIITALSMTVTVTSIISDIIISVLPIPLLWNVKINRYSKLAAGFLLSLGLFASICSMVRLAYTLALTSTDDYLFHIYGVTVWCYQLTIPISNPVAEVGVALTVGSLSTLRPLCASCLGSGHHHHYRRSRNHNGDPDNSNSPHNSAHNRDPPHYHRTWSRKSSRQTFDPAGGSADSAGKGSSVSYELRSGSGKKSKSGVLHHHHHDDDGGAAVGEPGDFCGGGGGGGGEVRMAVTAPLPPLRGSWGREPVRERGSVVVLSSVLPPPPPSSAGGRTTAGSERSLNGGRGEEGEEEEDDDESGRGILGLEDVRATMGYGVSSSRRTSMV